MNIILIYFAIKYKGDWDAIYKALESREKVAMQEWKDLEEKIKLENWKILTILDIDYPNKLKDAFKPPFAIWLYGNPQLLDNKIICSTGNEVDELTNARIEKAILEIEKCHTLLVPGFKGVDEKVKEASKKGKIFVLAEGIASWLENNSFNANDLLISEYPWETHPNKDYFRNRNRIIASFSESLILFSSDKNGPMNNMVSNFLNVGKEIYCFPGNGNENDGNSDLIKQGANLITEIKDISS